MTIKRGTRVRVAEPGMSPWIGTVVQVAPSSKGYTSITVMREDGYAWVMPIDMASEEPSSA